MPFVHVRFQIYVTKRQKLQENRQQLKKTEMQNKRQQMHVQFQKSCKKKYKMQKYGKNEKVLYDFFCIFLKIYTKKTKMQTKRMQKGIVGVH